MGLPGKDLYNRVNDKTKEANPGGAGTPNPMLNVSYDPNEKGSWERAAIGKTDSYLDSLSPAELYDRYVGIARHIGNQNFDDYIRNEWGVATAKDKAFYTAFKSAQDTLGRQVTPNEFAQIANVFYNPADYGSGISTGRAYLANFAEQDKNNPANLAGKAGQYGGQINDIFNELLKRGATQDEVNHFGKMLASGETDPYELRSFVQQMPEYQKAEQEKQLTSLDAQDAASREALNKELQASDLDYFNKAKDTVVSDLTRRGIQASPAMDFALTNLMGDIQKQRSAYMADLARQDYASRRSFGQQNYLTDRGANRQDYLNQLNNYLGQQDYNRQRGNQLSDLYLNRTWQGQDYATQMRDYNNYLRNMQGGGGGMPWGSLAGGLAGATIGGFASGGNPMGISAGYQIGTGVGGGYDQYRYGNLR